MTEDLMRVIGGAKVVDRPTCGSFSAHVQSKTLLNEGKDTPCLKVPRMEYSICMQCNMLSAQQCLSLWLAPQSAAS